MSNLFAKGKRSPRVKPHKMELFAVIRSIIFIRKIAAFLSQGKRSQGSSGYSDEIETFCFISVASRLFDLSRTQKHSSPPSPNSAVPGIQFHFPETWRVRGNNRCKQFPVCTRKKNKSYTV